LKQKVRDRIERLALKGVSNMRIAKLTKVQPREVESVLRSSDAFMDHLEDRFQKKLDARHRNYKVQPQPLIARASERDLPQYVGPDGRVDWRALPWVVQSDLVLSADDRLLVRECACEMCRPREEETSVEKLAASL
jgi:hypothetical protein